MSIHKSTDKVSNNYGIIDKLKYTNKCNVVGKCTWMLICQYQKNKKVNNNYKFV